MEQLALLGYNPHIHMVLKSFQDAAMHSLRGPSRYISTWNDDTRKMSDTELEEYKRAFSGYIKGETMDIKASHRAALQSQIPFLFSMDTSSCERSETNLEGETIACFVVGGEKRLCLPQILNTLLRPFSMEQVYEACNELHIFFSRCTLKQLHILKSQGVLPDNAPNCGLITKTDAERLCHKMLYSCPEKSNLNPPTPNSFKVYHECFGKCKGVFIPELYTHPHAMCVKCCDCEGMFSPPHFVCHSHKALENRTCHWGFDSANWRSYLLLAKDQSQLSHMIKLEKCLEEIKEKFDLKRKESPDGKNGEKKFKYEDVQQIPNLTPWKASLCGSEVPAFLQRTGPPVILNPERMVPFTSTQKQSNAARGFAPNVSLAPACQQQRVKKEDGAEGSTSSNIAPEDLRVTGKKGNSSNRSAEEEEEEVEEGDGDNNIDVSLEIDTSSTTPVTETETLSNNSDSGVSTPTEKTFPQVSLCIPEREQELKMLRDALEGKVANTDKAREEFIEDFMRLRIREDIKLKQLENVKRDLQKELEFVKFAKKQKVQELTEAKKGLKKEVERLRIERDIKSQELEEERKHTSLQMTTACKTTNPLKVKTHYKRKVEALKTKLNQHDQMHLQMSQEIEFLREELREFGKEVPNIKYEIAADEPALLSPLLLTPPLSGEQLPGEEDDGGGGGGGLFSFQPPPVMVGVVRVKEEVVDYDHGDNEMVGNGGLDCHSGVQQLSHVSTECVSSTPT